jgi:5'-3' exonuclease
MRVLIVDGNNLVAKTAYVWDQSKNAEGFPTGGLYGSVVMLRAFLAREPHDAVVMSIDWGSPKFRRTVCPEYKAQRADQKTPEDEQRYQRYKAQVAVVHEVVVPLGIVTARAKDWEGDDVIASLALERLKDHKVTIYSTDRDFVQLVDGERVFLFDHNRDEWREPDPDFCLKRCLDPKASDNLDGVPGIGPKKADRIVGQWRAHEDALGEEFEKPECVDRFIAWCSAQPKDKAAMSCVVEQQKIRANWRCSYLPAIVPECNPALKFRRGVPDAPEFKEACKLYNLRPLLEDFTTVWQPFSRLKAVL